ncbi:MAG: site-specific DNA-methyltransferase [Melioribacter sp.]|nr:site-specific DNA-methyltransferase [Melioribacter sp.]
MKKTNVIYNVDSRELLKIIKLPKIDLIITSPPYSDLKDYGTRGQIGYGQDYETEYLPSLKNIFFQCYVVTKQTGSMWVVVDTFKKNGSVKLLPFDIATICTESGWILRDIIVWDKGRTLPWSRKGQLRNRFEYILFFTKSAEYKYYVDRIKDPIDLKEWWVKYPERYSQRGKNPGNIWNIQIPVQGSWSTKNFRHFCPFPTELVEKILLLSSDKKDLVLDPFAGSGVVLAKAYSMKRKYVGFEINQRYIDMFKKIVLPEIGSDTKLLIRRNSIEQKRRDLEYKITALRALKYPKVMLKILKEKNKELSREILGAYVEVLNKSGITSNKFAFLYLIIIVNHTNNLSSIKAKLESIIKKPPLSKYGMDIEIKILQKSKLIASQQSLITNPKIFLYSNGKTHYYYKQIKNTDIKLFLNDWTKEIRPRFNHMPIFSPMGIRQNILKTWKPKYLDEKR